MAPMSELLSREAIGPLVHLGLGIFFLVYFVISYALTRISAAHVILFLNLIPIPLLLCGALLAGAPEEA
ncbi:hypothetical protein N1030_02320 [Desulfovibrio mangrovi]|uniref:hypothetical protein n=1 Tax=Desulfovibrio mangrovi TaxID=2976983 RepID=UPI002244FF98|nr:hypothetical protein [Desulfovibrio mangrovi]UZP67829.1 hypothetical protein N1030_02320 [Desulfovibrio mangrovi]